MSAAAEALEALGHPGGTLPEPRRLADLFARFQAQVPLRAVEPGGTPEQHLEAWLEEGAGLCGAARTAAFGAIAAAAGFDLSPALARHSDGPDRLVHLADGGRLLLDSSFPLPFALSLDPPAEGEATGYGTLSVRCPPEGAWELRLETRGDERPLFRVRPGGAPETGDPRLGCAGTRLFRLLDDRLLRWRDGILEVSDAWSRFRVPFPAADVDGLEALFGPALPTLPPASAVPAPEATLAAYHASAEEPARLLALLADPATHRALLPEGWTVDGATPFSDGFERTLLEAGTFLRRERLRVAPDGVRVEATGPLALFRTRTWRLEPRASGTRLRLLATLRDPVPPRGLPEGTRRRLVFELASELLALDRLASGL